MSIAANGADRAATRRIAGQYVMSPPAPIVAGYNPPPERPATGRDRLFPMHVFFEDDGQLKAGTVLADNATSLQVEAASGKRLKVKAAAVLLRFAAPSPSALNAEAQKLAAELDPNFLWEVSADDEFGFADLAHEYYGRMPAAPEAAAVAIALADAPMYFYKRGKGRYRKAPPDALKSALASVERKLRESEQMASWEGELRAHRLPATLRAKLPMLLYKPDKNALEWKALSAACDALRTNPVALLAQCGAVPSSHEYHYNAFLAQAFPKGVEFPAWGTLPALPDTPLAEARAFSIDDHTTTEIDDAFSVRALGNGHHEIGIHIAAPALSIARGSPLDAIARDRLSTVYMPGRKITMLPDAAITDFHAVRGTGAARFVAVRRSRLRRRAHPPRDARQPDSDRRQPSPRHDRRRVRQRRCRRRPILHGPPSSVCCGRSRARSLHNGARRISRASTTASTSTGMRRPTVGSRSSRGPAVRRRTSSSPS